MIKFIVWRILKNNVEKISKNKRKICIKIYKKGWIHPTLGWA
jgi:hypothetical protein